jgi:sporulation protein YlmC with PRC-barrel domain
MCELPEDHNGRTSHNQQTIMLTKAYSLISYELDSLDGKIGKVKDFYFDDRLWKIRYLIVDTGKWLPGRQVLLSPQALSRVNDTTDLITVALTKKQIEDSPSLADHKPVSRQFEDAYYCHYGWPPYWTGLSIESAYFESLNESDKGMRPKQTENGADQHLRSTHEVSQYSIHAIDGGIGHVEDFIIDDETWKIRYLAVNLNNWWAGKKVLISPQWIERISVFESEVFLGLSREEIKQSPEYSEEALVTREYEARLYKHYHRPEYWVNELMTEGSSVLNKAVF